MSLPLPTRRFPVTGITLKQVLAIPFVLLIGSVILIGYISSQSENLEHTNLLSILSILTLVGCSGISWLTMQWIVLPILRLNIASQALARGEWHQALSENLAIAELQNLTKSFNVLAEQLNQSRDENNYYQSLLGNSESELKAFWDNCPAVIYIKDLEGKYQWVNREFEDVLKTSHSQIFGKTDQDFLPVEIAHSLQSNDLQSIREGKPIHLEESIVLPNGVVHTYFATKFPLVDEHGNPYGVGGISFDISDRKKKEDTLRRFERIISATSDCIALIDVNYNYLLINQTYIDWHDKSYEEIIGHSVSNLFGADFFQTVKPRFDRCLQGEIQNFESWVEYVKNGRRYVTATYSPYVELSGEISGIVINVRDVTDRKLVEQELRQSEAKQAAVINALPDLIMVLNHEGIYTEFISTNAFSGIDRNRNFVGTNVRESLPEETAQKRIDAVQTVLKTGLMEVYEQEIEVDGKRQIEEVRVFPYRDHEALILVRDISDRKAAEEALRKSESENLAILAAIPDLIFQVSADGIYLKRFSTNSVKDAIILDKNPIGKSLAEVLPADVSDLKLSYIQKALQTGEPQVYEQILEINGILQYEEVRIVKLNDHAALTMIRNISDRKQVEIQLQQSEETNRAILSAIPDLLLRIGRDGTCYDFIPPESEEFGTFVPVRQNLAEILPPDLLEFQLQRMEQALATNQLQVWEHQILKHGKLCDEEVRVVPCGTNECLVMVRDITDRKFAEQELLKQYQHSQLLAEVMLKIRQSLELKEILKTTVTEIHHILQCDRVIIYQILPDRNGQVLEKSVTNAWQLNLDQKLIDNCFSAEISERYQKERISIINDLDSANVNSFHADFLKQLDVKAMLVAPILMSGSLWGLLIGHQCDRPRQWNQFETELMFQIAYQVGIALTQSQLVEDLRASKLEADAAAKAKSEFLANMSHEIRTPMNGVLGMAQLLATTHLDEEQKDFIKTIQDSGTALLTIINDILDFSKIESRNLQLEERVFILEDVLVSICKLLHRQALDKNINLRYTLPSGFSTIMGDDSRLRQILLNLVGNAIKFTEQGRVSISVTKFIQTIDESPNDYKFIFAITDSGIGIKSDRLAILFQPFSQADNSISRRYGGTGLGLAICKSLIELMGGQIWVESFGQIGGNPPAHWIPSSPTQGSTFYFTMVASEPSQINQINQLPQTTTPQIPDDETMAWHLPLAILLAEDNLVNQKVASFTLKKLGYEVDIANNGQEAIEALQKRIYDVVLMDMQMPKVDGLTATKWIRSNLRKQPIIIAMTANVLESDRQACLEAGMNDYLSKPINITEIIRVFSQI